MNWVHWFGRLNKMLILTNLAKDNNFQTSENNSLDIFKNVFVTRLKQCINLATHSINLLCKFRQIGHSHPIHYAIKINLHESEKG